MLQRQQWLGKKQSSSEEDASVSSSEPSEEIDQSQSGSDDSDGSDSEVPKKRAPAKKRAPPKKRATKRKRDPKAPKKKQSAYMFFLAQNRERIKQENPGIQFGEVGRKAGQMWNALSAEEKQPYNALSEKDKTRFEKEMENYTPEDDSDEEAPPKKRSKAATTKKKKDPNAPKAAINAYFFYVRENREDYKSKHPGMKTTDITKALGKQWKEMAEKEKEPYQKLADQDKERYKKEMAEYNG